ncbi:hypothetical protein ABMA57_07505 [Saccharospirillum sp. HFRX-1]|uniref:hypothetical protein n=1 Tax=unclassified Saccharospirillum TaxID=2633430 RepID=UPI00370F9FA1
MAMHLMMTGWPRAMCGRDTIKNNLETTDRVSEVTCKVCLARWERLQVTEPYAGEPIRVCEIEHWQGLEASERRVICRRHRDTRNLAGFAWYQFSSRQRSLLLDAMRWDGAACLALGIPGRDAGPLESEHLRQLWRVQLRIIERVRDGRQEPADLARVVEIQTELAREVLG